MKQFLISLTLSFTLIAGMIFAAHGKFAVTYEQIFAEKKITLTEHLTLSEQNLLQHKKGFIKYVE